jgi:hypothetical protein
LSNSIQRIAFCYFWRLYIEQSKRLKPFGLSYWKQALYGMH